MSKLGDDIYNVSVTINELINRKKEINKEAVDAESSLRSLNSKFAGRRRLTDKDYKKTIKQQVKLKKRIVEIRTTILEPINKEIRDWRAVENKIRAEILESDNILSSKSIHNSKDKKLLELRDKYRAFGEDQTRVNSMRIMAAKFATEITIIIEDD